MARSFLRRMTAWLCLVVALLSGFAPAQGLTLCFRPDGELGMCPVEASQACTCCESEDESAPTTAVARHHSTGCCACHDVAIPAASHAARVAPRAVEIDLGQCTSVTRVAFVLPRFVPPPAAWTRRAPPPRPPDSIALIRSVVLHV